MKFIKLVFAVFVLSFALSNAAFAQSTAKVDDTSIATNLQRKTVKVKGATCKVDIGMIVDKVKKIDGVKSCVIAKHGAVSALNVEYYASKVDMDAIQMAIETTGTCSDPNARRYKVKL